MQMQGGIGDGTKVLPFLQSTKAVYAWGKPGAKI